MKKKGSGVKTDKMERVVTLRKKGLTFQEISKLMDEDIKSVYRWHKYSVTTFVGRYYPMGVDK